MSFCCDNHIASVLYGVKPVSVQWSATVNSLEYMLPEDPPLPCCICEEEAQWSVSVEGV